MTDEPGGSLSRTGQARHVPSSARPCASRVYQPHEMDGQFFASIPGKRLRCRRLVVAIVKT